MGFFDKSKKKVLQQDLTQKTENQGSIFVVQLLMKEMCAMPSKEKMTEIMKKHLGDVDCFIHDNKIAGFAPKKYKVEFKDGSMPPQLLVLECLKTDDFKVDEIARSQMWDCPDSDRILSECKYQVVANDMLARAMDYHDRTGMLVDYIEALVEMYPTCEAVYIQTSGKMRTSEQVINNNIPKEQRFIYYAVNARFFNIQGTEDKLVDTLGMGVLYMPDLQYHFHGMDPNPVVNHAYNLLTYMFDNDCPFKSGETIDGIENGEMSPNMRWRCQFEDSLIQPVRPVMDVDMGEFASGKRE